jgi:hypothetical protein
MTAFYSFAGVKRGASGSSVVSGVGGVIGPSVPAVGDGVGGVASGSSSGGVGFV